MNKVIDVSIKVTSFNEFIRMIQWFEVVCELGEYAYNLFGINVHYDQPSGSYVYLENRRIWIDYIFDDNVSGTWSIYIDYSVPQYPIEHVIRVEDNRISVDYLTSQTTTTCVEQNYD